MPILRDTPGASTLNGAMAAGLAALLMFGPLAFGAVEEWSVFVLRAGAAVLFMLWAARQVLRGEIEVARNPLYWPLAAFGTLIIAQIALGRTVYQYASIAECLNYAVYAPLFFVSAQVLKDEAQLKRLAVVLSVFGFLLALFAIAQDLTFNGKLYWIRAAREGAVIYGPYVNHNHYAGLMELLAPIPLALAMGGYLQGSRRALAAFAGVVMAGTIFLSLSRGGMIAFSIQIVLLALLLAHKGGAQRATAIGVVVVLGAAFLFWMANDQFVNRLATLRHPLQEENAVNRLAIAKDTVRMFADRPLTGWGLGVFPFVYPVYRSFYDNAFVNQAHNDYAQLLAETGLVGFALLLWSIYLLFKLGVGAMRRSNHLFTASMRAAALVGCSGILVHSFCDFNMHLPANAALFFVLAAVATLQPRSGFVLRSPKWRFVQGRTPVTQSRP
jgi:O-antigen ligase